MKRFAAGANFTLSQTVWTPAPPPSSAWAPDTTPSATWSPDTPPFAAWDVESTNLQRITESSVRRVTEDSIPLVRVIERYRSLWNRESAAFATWE